MNTSLTTPLTSDQKDSFVETLTDELNSMLTIYEEEIKKEFDLPASEYLYKLMILNITDMIKDELDFDFMLDNVTHARLSDLFQGNTDEGYDFPDTMAYITLGAIPGRPKPIDLELNLEPKVKEDSGLRFLELTLGITIVEGDVRTKVVQQEPDYTYGPYASFEDMMEAEYQRIMDKDE
ncbi:hypothetical protein FVR03_21695 [Pontibacter qinzhouensis]|uniref:Uncharacterized protein n=1 Tax=Pontibacter qinzhouensis TaxID=2603253 RepID=A0A5C8IZB5_9BACT|nr:hypothetical protein [Pontibacter qinzhouensis]TXK26539.1 hypothetical protein FVR03_21695 [Pontibacter qinzhouensis]